MTKGHAAQPKGSQDNDTVRRGLALVISLVVIAWIAAYAVSPAKASPGNAAAPTAPIGESSLTIITTSSSTTTSTTRPRPTTTNKPTTTQEPTTQTTATPTTEEEPDEPVDTTDPPDEDTDDEVTTTRAEFGTGPIETTQNLLTAGNGLSGSKAKSAQKQEDKPAKSGTASDEDRVIWMIIAGLGAVALLVALLTWRYWLLTRPGLDLSDPDDPDDGGYDGGGHGGGGYDGGAAYANAAPAQGPGDPYSAAPAPRMSEVNPMTTGMPPAPAATGWQDPPPQRPPSQRPARRGGGRAAVPPPQPEGGRRGRRGQSPDADPFFGQDGGQAPPSRGRGGRGRRGSDPFGWDDDGGSAPRRQPPPGQPRRRPDQRGGSGGDPWGRDPR